MAQISLRDIQLTYDGNTLTITSPEHPERSVVLDAGAVEELVDFVKLFAPVERPDPEKEKDGDGDNRREAFRVPFVDDCGLRSTIVIGKKRYSVQPVNISMNGILVRIPRNSDLRIRIDDEVDVEIMLDKWKVNLEAVVRREAEGGFGLFFPSTMRGNHVEPPSALRRIVMDLQRRWMSRAKDD